MLQDLIDNFKSCPKGAVFKNGFDNPHSYRGDYEQLAVEPCENVPVEYMISILEDALGKQFTGYKGGEFTMYGYVDVYLSEYGVNSRQVITGWGAKIGEGFTLLTEDKDIW